MKTLIVYGSKYGFTEECAMKLKGKMGKDTVCINLKKEQVKELDRYSHVLIGSPIYAGAWQKEVKAFCEEHLQVLLKKQVGIFGSGGAVSEFRKAVEQNVPKELFAHAKVIICFGGEFRLDKMNFFERAIVKMIGKAKAKENGNTENPEGLLPSHLEEFVKVMSK